MCVGFYTAAAPIQFPGEQAQVIQSTQQVVPRPTEQFVIAFAAVECVVAAAAEEGVVASKS